MATATAPRKAPNPVTAVIPATLDNSELMALLEQAGMTAKGGDASFHRMVLKAGTLITDEGTPDEEAWPPTKRGPTMVVRIAQPPIYYNAFFLSAEEKNGAINGSIIGRADLNGKFVKKYDDAAEQALDQYANAEVYEDIARATSRRGSFKADIQLQIVPESGVMTGNEPVYTLSMSTTAALDWRGSSKNPAGGVVQEKNFIVQLAELAQAQAIALGGDKTDQAQAVLNAMTALRLGGVVAEIYLRTAESDDKTFNWVVPSFKPIHIELGTEQPALEDGDSDLIAADPLVDSDVVPF